MPVHQEKHMAQSSITSIEQLVKHGYTWAVGTAEEINAKHLGWWFFENHTLVSASQRIQVRGGTHLAPPTEVTDYAQMMKMGDQFPPIIITNDGWLVDGHTRTEAARKLKWKTFPTFVLNVRFKDLDVDSALYKNLLKLGAAQNNKHGRRMTPADIAVIIEQISEGETPKQIQRDLHVGSNFANMVWNAARAKRNALKLGISYQGDLSNSHLRLFGGKLDKYTDPVWGRMFSLTQDAHLGIKDVNDLMKRVEALRTDDERIALLDHERVIHRTSISQGVRVPDSKSRKAKQTLGFWVKEENTPDSIVERDPAKGPEFMKWLDIAIEKMTKTRAQQAQIEAARVTTVE